MIKFNEPLTWPTVIEGLKTMAIVGGIVYGAAYFTAETRGADAEQRHKFVTLQTELMELKRDGASASNRLAILETNVTHIRESLARIEQAVRRPVQ